MEVVQVEAVGLIGGGGGDGGGCRRSGGGAGGRWWWWWRVVSAVANWRRAEPVALRELKYILCDADKDCLALTNCFMYLFLDLHLETVSSLSSLEKQQPISLFFFLSVKQSTLFLTFSL